MRQPLATAFFTCSHCDAAYDSGALLQGHKITAHRGSGLGPVSYTHLDVYKRQVRNSVPVEPVGL